VQTGMCLPRLLIRSAKRILTPGVNMVTFISPLCIVFIKLFPKPESNTHSNRTLI